MGKQKWIIMSKLSRFNVESQLFRLDGWEEEIQFNMYLPTVSVYCSLIAVEPSTEITVVLKMPSSVFSNIKNTFEPNKMTAFLHGMCVQKLLQ